MTTDPLVPDAARRAAKRGFLRTTAQAYAASIPTGGVSAGAIVALVQDPNPLLIAATIIAALVSPPLAGLASALSILSKGIPEDYQAAT
jgi:hypothetical protein